MSYRDCAHYDELLKLVATKGNLDEVSFELEDIADCKIEDCTGVCSLWVSLTFIKDLPPQMNMEIAEVTIDNVDDIFSDIFLEIMRRAGKNKDAEKN